MRGRFRCRLGRHIAAAPRSCHALRQPRADPADKLRRERGADCATHQFADCGILHNALD
jgi:hypothetical protein